LDDVASRGALLDGALGMISDARRTTGSDGNRKRYELLRLSVERVAGVRGPGHIAEGSHYLWRRLPQVTDRAVHVSDQGQPIINHGRCSSSLRRTTSILKGTVDAPNET